MKDDLHAHLRPHDHPSSTVIHTHEDETILARWLRRGIEQGAKFWILLGGVLVVAIALSVLVNGLMLGESTAATAWKDLAAARTSDEQRKVAEAFPKTAAGRWALFEAAESIYYQGLELLTANRDEASPLLRKAYQLFSQVYDGSAQTDPTLARFAAMGMARTLEASNDLKRAVEQYRRVAKTWPDTAEGRRAARLARALEDSKNVEFYNWLANYKPPSVTLPPMGKGLLDIPPPAPTPEAGKAAGSGPGPGAGPGPSLPSSLPDIFENSSKTPSEGGAATSPSPSPSPSGETTKAPAAPGPSEAAPKR